MNKFEIGTYKMDRKGRLHVQKNGQFTRVPLSPKAQKSRDTRNLLLLGLVGAVMMFLASSYLSFTDAETAKVMSLQTMAQVQTQHTDDQLTLAKFEKADVDMANGLVGMEQADHAQIRSIIEDTK